MSKNLVIVESPAKAKTINKYLGKDYTVMASIGHIKDLPSKDLGVDVENNFEPTYEVIPDTKKRNNKKIVAELKKAAKASEAIYLAADPDREGEAICQHLAEEIVPKKGKQQVYRVMFNEITKNAIQDAFKHPKQINKNLVDAQQARRILDRLVGYKVSPLLWQTIGGSFQPVACSRLRCAWSSNANARSKHSSRPNTGRSSRISPRHCRRLSMRVSIRSTTRRSKPAGSIRT